MGTGVHRNSASISGKGTSPLWKTRGKPEGDNRKGKGEGRQTHPHMLELVNTTQSLIPMRCISAALIPTSHQSLNNSMVQWLKLRKVTKGHFHLAGTGRMLLCPFTGRTDGMSPKSYNASEADPTIDQSGTLSTPPGFSRM